MAEGSSSAAPVMTPVPTALRSPPFLLLASSSVPATAMLSFAPVSVGARGADRPGECKTSTLVPDQRHQGLRNSLSLFCRARSPDGTSSVASTEVSDIAGKDHHIIVGVFYPA